MKLRKRQSYLNSIPEGSPRKRKIVFLSKILYFVIIGSAVAYIITYFVLNYYLFIFTTGQIEAEKFYVQAKRDCEVTKYFVKKGQKIAVDQPLVEIRTQQSNDAKKRYLYSSKISNNLELSQIESKIKVLKGHLADKRQELEMALLFKSIRKVKENDYSVLSSKNKQYPDIKKEISDIGLKIELLNAERLQLLQHKRVLEDEDSIEANFKYDEVIKSRFDGRVDRIVKHAFEYAYRGENLLIIEDPQKIIIKAYFEPEHYNYLYEGKQVLIEFPDGKSSYGIIKKVYSTAFQHSQRLAKMTKGSIKIMADIAPDDKRDYNLWKPYIGMELTIRLNRSKR